VDVSRKAILWAEERARNSGFRINFLCQSIFDLQLEASVYDTVYDSGCFHHIPPHRRMNYLELVQHALKPAGLFGLTCFTPEGGSDLSDWEVYRRRTLGGGLGYSEGRLRRIFEGQFEILELRRMKEMDTGSGLFGKAFLWTMLMRPRSGNDDSQGG
jgi:SAM-dependent methyltransferase